MNYDARNHELKMNFWYFRLLISLDPRSSSIVRNVVTIADRRFFKGQGEFLTFQDGTDRLSQNVGKELTTVRCPSYQKRADPIYIAAETWNHAPSFSVVKVERQIDNKVSLCTMQELIGVALGSRI